MATITLLKTPDCRTNCDTVKGELSRFDIDFEFVVIDEKCEAHMTAVEQARSAGFLASPIACTLNDDGTLRYIAAGPSQIAIQLIKKAANVPFSVKV